MLNTMNKISFKEGAQAYIYNNSTFYCQIRTFNTIVLSFHYKASLWFVNKESTNHIDFIVTSQTSYDFLNILYLPTRFILFKIIHVLSSDPYRL